MGGNVRSPRGSSLQYEVGRSVLGGATLLWGYVVVPTTIFTDMLPAGTEIGGT